MSLSAKKYFVTLRYIDCNDCEFYHADVGYCEKVKYQKKPHDEVCRAFASAGLTGSGVAPPASPDTKLSTSAASSPQKSAANSFISTTNSPNNEQR